MGTIFGRQPAVWIGLIVTIVLGIVQTLNGQGFVSDLTAGKITDIVQALALLLTSLAPIIATLLTHQLVTPTAAPVLAAGTAVTTPAGTAATVTVTRATS